MSFSRIIKLLAAIHIFIGLLAGYWDMRLSNSWIYQDQMARVHLLRALQAHIVLSIIIVLAIAVLLWLHQKRSKIPLDRSLLIANQIAFGISLLLFLIFFIKTHLIWLQTHLFSIEGLLWTALITAGSILMFFAIRYLAIRISQRSSSKSLVAGIFLICMIVTIADAYIDRKANLPQQTSAANRPNILLIVVDTLRWDFVSAYGFPHPLTPNIDALAREGVLYENAISPSPWTTPSHASLFIGQYPSRNGVDGRNILLDPTSKTLASELSRSGFQTAGFINNVYIRRQTGLGRGFQQYEEFWGRNECSSIMLLIEFLREKFNPREDTGAMETRNAIIDWLHHDWTGKHPFFLFVHLMEPHAPYGAPSSEVQKFLPRGVTPQQAAKVNQDPEIFITGKLKMTARDFEILTALYQNDVNYVDSVIGEIIQDFRHRNLLDNTLVIFTSDHGEHFGENGLMSHELSLYDVLIHVPLVIRFPNRNHAGTRIKETVQTIDIFPSVLRFLKSESKLDLQGFSLLPDFFERKNHPYAFSEYNNLRAADKMKRRFPDLPDSPIWRTKVLKSVRTEDWKFIWSTDGIRELYSIANDPYEKNNLAQSNPEQIKKMQEILAKWSLSFKPSRFYQNEEISREALDELRSLNYVQ
ncbi:sulfatase-like hydrolase/transferase [bacterium]|nr:sulfatase-like hydrolase/transferase [bacterium]